MQPSRRYSEEPSRPDLPIQEQPIGAGDAVAASPLPTLSGLHASAARTALSNSQISSTSQPFPTSQPSPASQFSARHKGHKSSVYAALDLGTNNCRLLVAQPAIHGFRVIDAFSRIVRLGEGLSAAGSLNEDAISRSLEALHVCAAKMLARGVTRARMIATEACRTAHNGEAFISRVRREVGLDLEIVDRQTEALLAASGCVALAAPDADSVILFDIGGGSTELIWLGARDARGGIAERVREWTSLRVGVVTLAERHGGRDVDRVLFETMAQEVVDLVAPFAQLAKDAPRQSGFHLLGTSGTVTTLAGLHLNLDRYDRRKVDGLWMRGSEVDGVIDGLLNLNFEQRALSPCIGKDRADLVLAGCAILEGIRRSFPAERMRVADRGLREGILMNMMRDDRVWRRRRR